ncbi:MAG TPA: GtrA family protein [Clostridia bacterium]|nr:GtrA family protein [Clostridia bacterium]
MIAWFKRFRQEHETLAQLILFTVLSGVATLVDLSVFSLLNYWLLKPLKSVDFVWWLLDYNAVDGGGLGGLIATAAAYFAAQVANFFVQRKGTFQANNNAAASGALYFVMIVAIWFLQIYLGGLFMRWFAAPFGENLGDILSRLANNTVAFLIQFPLNKYVIMRKTAKGNPEPERNQGNM